MIHYDGSRQASAERTSVDWRPEQSEEHGSCLRLFPRDLCHSAGFVLSGNCTRHCMRLQQKASRLAGCHNAITASSIGHSRGSSTAAPVPRRRAFVGHQQETRYLLTFQVSMANFKTWMMTWYCKKTFPSPGSTREQRRSQKSNTFFFFFEKAQRFHRHSRWLYIQQQSSSFSSNRFCWTQKRLLEKEELCCLSTTFPYHLCARGLCGLASPIPGIRLEACLALVETNLKTLFAQFVLIVHLFFFCAYVHWRSWAYSDRRQRIIISVLEPILSPWKKEEKRRCTLYDNWGQVFFICFVSIALSTSQISPSWKVIIIINWCCAKAKLFYQCLYFHQVERSVTFQRCTAVICVSATCCFCLCQCICFSRESTHRHQHVCFGLTFRPLSQDLPQKIWEAISGPTVIIPAGCSACVYVGFSLKKNMWVFLCR